MNTNDIISMYGDHRSSDYSEYSSEKRFNISLDLIKNLTGKRFENISILDYGCGPGNFPYWCVQRGLYFGNYLGYDIRHDSLNFAKTRFTDDWVKFAYSLDPSEKFDVGLLLGVISYRYGDIENCKQDALDIINSLINTCQRGLIVSFARSDCPRERIKPFNQYSREEVEDIINRCGCNVIGFDDFSFDHEYIVGFQK